MNLELLNVKEHSSEKYPPRTYYNATSADLTIAFAIDLNTAGEKLTHKAAGKKYIGFLLTDDSDTLVIARELYKRMRQDNVKTVNIAGNGIYTLAGQQCSQDFINQFVYEVLAKVHQFMPIQKIYTGGQTGVDLAGAVSGVALGVLTEVTLPNGFKQRFENNVDVNGTQEGVIEQITTGAKTLLSKYKVEAPKSITGMKI